MTQEDKELLFQDLCCRLPYGVKVNISASRPDRYDNFVKSINVATINSIDLNMEKCNFKEFWWSSYIVNVRPYLRPMSSMTEEERQEYINIDNRSYSCPMDYAHIPASDRMDWLNAHHFDYRGLIGRGLAIEAPEGMYIIKEQ